MWIFTSNIVDSVFPNHPAKLFRSAKFNKEDFALLPTIKFRLLDGDGEVYFEGLMDKIQYNEEDGINGPFEPLDMFLYSYGCTEIQFFNTETNKWETL